MNFEDINKNIQIITGLDDTVKISLISKKAYKRLKRMIDFNENEEIEYTDDIGDVITDMSVYMLNTLARAGVQSEKVIDFSFTYGDGLPLDIKKDIDALGRKIKGSCFYTKDMMKVAFDGISELFFN